LVAASSPDELSPDAALQLRAAEGSGVNLRLGSVPDYLWLETELVVDCLLGTGATGELREPYKTWAEKINLAGERGVPILACDVPTGVDAADGSLAEGAVAASLTVTFHAAKSGLTAPPGAEAAGEVLVWDIGLPRWLEPEPDLRVVTESEVRLPGRRPDDHKYRAGFVAVVAGSAAYPGAALLAAGGAGKAGAGYVRLVAPGGAAGALRAASLEVVVREAGPGEVLSDLAALREATGDASISALVIGPGLGRAPQTAEALRALVACLERPAIIDADGLLAFAGRAEELRAVSGLVLTPHTGELAFLLGEKVSEVTGSHLVAARRGARATGQVLLLKGSTSVIVAPDGETWVVPGGGPQLASAGTGDVLSGVIGAFLARGMEPLQADKAGAWVHAEAGRRAAVGRRGGLLAGDLLDSLPAVVSERTYERRPGWRT
jgi:NAD(P)H-hydrate epimerase